MFTLNMVIVSDNEVRVWTFNPVSQTLGSELCDFYRDEGISQRCSSPAVVRGELRLSPRDGLD